MLTRYRLTEIRADAFGKDITEIVRFLKDYIGRWTLAHLVGKPNNPNFKKADLLVRRKRQPDIELVFKLRSCYLVARLVFESEGQYKGSRKGRDTPANIARNWLMLSCLGLHDQAPISKLRDMQSLKDLSLITNAAESFIRI